MDRYIDLYAKRGSYTGFYNGILYSSIPLEWFKYQNNFRMLEDIKELWEKLNK